MVALLAYGFVIWSCVEMHRLNDLTPIAYIGTSVIGLLAAVVSAYMWRAKQQDTFQLELKKSEEMAKLREKYGANLQSSDAFIGSSSNNVYGGNDDPMG